MMVRPPQAPYQSREVQAAREELPGDHASDPREVQDGPEMAAPRASGIDGGNRNIHDTHAAASGLDQDLALEHETRIARGPWSELLQQLRRVDPKA